MCSSASCLGYLLLFLAIFFALFIYFLLKARAKLLKHDLEIQGDQLWKEFILRCSQKGFRHDRFIFSVWQDKTATISTLLVKDHVSEIVGKVEFPMGAREYRVLIEEEFYTIVVNLTWGGANLSLVSADGREVAQLKRNSFSPMKHTIVIPGLGELTSQQPMFDLKAPIVYSLNKVPVAETRLISSARRVGRMGCFSDEISLPVQIFVLSMTS